ncbi:hypothetical protein [Paenibacillus glacialis]|uniref:Uncharacterized protein n=1 Tax=Paenibacillus glacialis TaxID=494026 RepID=A0A168KV49_9BACL|nr:hypothetical protein [Paenibacillus glacialis]OAB42505.1 hypothetical protein PGLA_12640 [Paenibacillus glacialis]
MASDQALFLLISRFIRDWVYTNIVAASHFVVATQTIVCRRNNPFDMGTITIGSFDEKSSFNIIKDSENSKGMFV